MTDLVDDDQRDDLNATRADLERLNGLVIRALIRKIEADEATATDIGNAVKVLISNRVSPKEPEGYNGYTNGIRESDMDFPVSF
jgi:hypothetical protein